MENPITVNAEAQRKRTVLIAYQNLHPSAHQIRTKLIPMAIAEETKLSRPVFCFPC